jgi:hypothetical protein
MIQDMSKSKSIITTKPIKFNPILYHRLDHSVFERIASPIRTIMTILGVIV